MGSTLNEVNKLSSKKMPSRKNKLKKQLHNQTTPTLLKVMMTSILMIFKQSLSFNSSCHVSFESLFYFSGYGCNSIWHFVFLMFSTVFTDNIVKMPSNMLIQHFRTSF